MRCAVYCRFSTDKQSPSSIDDQLRKCQEHAKNRGWMVLDEHVYRDEAVSGVGTDRPGLGDLLRAIEASPRPFDVLLVDDTSRLSRNLADQIHILDKLRFAGIRFVAVSQGIDSKQEQSDVLTTFHGMVDSLYVKELAKKTHRGLEGRFLKGLSAGGRCFGYYTVEADGGKRLAVNEAEARIVRRIFEMSADGKSLKTIAKTLNAEKVPPPKSRKDRRRTGWCPTAIRAMLYNERYAGRLVWNKTHFVKVPGTNRRVSRPRPESEWQVRMDESLRIVPDELWDRVQTRSHWIKEKYSDGRPAGLLSRYHHLLSGFLVCAECGGKLTIISTKPVPRYGCATHFNRGTCSNKLLVRKDELEERLLSGIQAEVLNPEAVDYALRQFEHELEKQLRGMFGQVEAVRRRKQDLETELARLTQAIALGGNLSSLIEAIAEREKELREIADRLVGSEPDSIKASLRGLREFVLSRLAGVRKALNSNPQEARKALARHIPEPIVMKPEAGRYVARGQWQHAGLSAEMVAGVGFEPTTSGL